MKSENLKIIRSSKKEILYTSAILGHEVKRAFKCDFCGKGSSEKVKLNAHFPSVHENEKPFKFEFCGRNFSQKGNLNGHIASVHENKRPFKCDLCDLGCSIKGSLNKHSLDQVQAIEMYGAAQPDFFKSEINGGIKTLFHII